jgi:cyclase
VLLQGLTAGATTLALPFRVLRGQPAGGIAVTDLGNGLSLIGGAGGNVLAAATDAGLVLVDTGSAAAVADLAATTAELSPLGVTAIFNTHWHPDQVGANAHFGGTGATIHAHEKTRQRLRAGYYLPELDRYAPAIATAGLPTATFFESGSTKIGGTPIEFGYLLEAHTDGDIYVAFPESNLIAVGDVIAPVSDPVLDYYGGGWLGGRLDALTRLLERSDGSTRFVPGVGPVVGRNAVEAELTMLTQLFDRFVERIRLGESVRDMLEAGILDGLGREFAEPERLVHDTYQGFWAHHNTLMHDIV